MVVGNLVARGNNHSLGNFEQAHWPSVHNLLSKKSRVLLCTFLLPEQVLRTF